METYYSIDYKSAEYPLEIYPQIKAASINGVAVYGSEKYMKILRETLAQRVAAISIRLSENSVDTDSPIYAINVEGWLQNTTLVSQKATPGGNRT
jgi:hypothetical protein